MSFGVGGAGTEFDLVDPGELGKGLRAPAKKGEKLSAIFMAARVTRGQGNSLVQIAFGSRPIPVMQPIDQAERIVRFSNGVVELHGLVQRFHG